MRMSTARADMKISIHHRKRNRTPKLRRRTQRSRRRERRKRQNQRHRPRPQGMQTIRESLNPQPLAT